MAAKKTKAKNSSNKKGVDIWHNLCIPPEIIQLLRSRRRIRRRQSLLHNLSSVCTTKSWIPATSRCSRSGENRLPELYNLSGNSSNNSSASTHQKYFHYITYQIGNAATDCRQILLYSADERAYIKYEFIATDPFDSKKNRMEFTSVIGFEGKFYALSLQGALAIIEIIDSRPTITNTSTSRAIPSVRSRFFKEYLLELNGEIYVFFFIHQKSLEIVDLVEVFRLCWDKLKWIKVEMLQGKTFFFDRRCSWVNSAEVGCREDCVYFTQGSDEGWWIYDMKSCCILPSSMENEE